MAGFLSRKKTTTILPDPDGEWRFDATELPRDGFALSPVVPMDVSNSQGLAPVDYDNTDRHSIEQAESVDLISNPPLPFDLDKRTASSQWLFKSELLFLNLRDQIAIDLARERDMGNLFNFVPVIFALGIATYFFASSEPSLIALVGSLAVCTTILFKVKSRGAVYGICLIGFLFFAGMTAAKYQVMQAIDPIPNSELTGKLQGKVLLVDQNQRGAPRYLIKPTSIEGLEPGEFPEKVRVSASRKHEVLKIGDGFEAVVRLQPISGPAYPSGYDFSFTSRLDGLAMSGFVMGVPQKGKPLDEPYLANSAVTAVERARSYITRRLRAGLPGEPGDIAAALITGDRSGLSNETQESLRRSGLAHILAISGLHMALVTLTVIWIIRLLIVLLPGFADRYPAKKLAVSAGFLTATLYLFLSGMGIATQRAWLMISIMLAASLMDRRAITMRSVALAAFVILVIAPASLFQPGFQMSFAAVAALVAVYQEWTGYNRRRKYRENQFEKNRWTRGILSYFGGLAATSLIAGTATALFAMWHFHRVAPMGLVSNLAAMPLVSMLVMPLSLLSMFLMPYGFENLALAPLGKSIEAVLKVSEWVNSYEFDFETGQKPILFLIFATMFLILGTFLRTRLRVIAFLPLAGVFFVLHQTIELPDILIAQDGSNIALRSSLLWEQGEAARTENGAEGMTLLYPRRGKFVTDIWQRAYLPNQEFDKLPKTVICSKDACSLLIGGKNMQVIRDPDFIVKACASADILVAPRLWWVDCKGQSPELIITRSDLERKGAHLIKGIGKQIEITQALPKPLEQAASRPWHQTIDIVGRKYPRKQNEDEKAMQTR